MDLFPDEILVKIFLFLSVEDIKIASLVCHKWHDIIDDNYLWKLVYVQEFPYEKIDQLSKHEMDFGFIIRHNLYYTKHNSKYNLSIDIPSELVWSRFYDEQRKLLLLGTYGLVIYNLQNFFTDRNVSYEINSYKNSERKIRIPTIFGSLGKIYPMNNLLFITGCSTTKNIEKNIQLLKFNDEHPMTITEIDVIETFHNKVSDIMPVDNHIFSVGKNDPIVGIWDIETDQYRSICTDLSNITAMNYSDSLLMFGSDNGKLLICDFNTEKCDEYTLKINRLSNEIRYLYHDTTTNSIIGATPDVIFNFDLRNLKYLYFEQVPENLARMKIHDGMIVWNSIFYDGDDYNGNLNVWKFNDQKIYKNKGLGITNVVDFQVCNRKLVVANNYTGYRFYDLICIKINHKMYIINDADNDIIQFYNF